MSGRARDVEEYEPSEVELIKDTKNWPHWPVLPVKRLIKSYGGCPHPRHDGRGPQHDSGNCPDPDTVTERQVGVVVAADVEKDTPMVHFVNMWGGNPPKMTREPIMYRSVSAMVLDGWVGD